MSSKLKTWKKTGDDFCNEVIPSQKLPLPHALKEVELTNELGECIGTKCAPFDPYLPQEDDENADVKDASLTLDPNNAAGYAATAALLKSTADVHTSGMSPIGSDDADVMTIVSQDIINLNNSTK